MMAGFGGLLASVCWDGFSGCGWLPVLFWVGGLLSLRGLGSVWPLALSGLGWWWGGGGCGLCPESRGRHARTSPSEVYPPGKLH